MSLIKATTGQHTTVTVANLKQSRDIKVVQAFNAEAGASASYTNAFGSLGPILSFTNMNDTPVTGKLDVLVSDNIDFQIVAMGLGPNDTYDGFSLERALNNPIYILLRERDVKSKTPFQGLWLKEVSLTGDTEDQTIKGIKAVSYGLSASDKIRLAGIPIIETLPVSSGSATLSQTPKTYNGVEFLPAGHDSDGSEIYFVSDVASGTLIPKSDWAVSGTSLTLSGDYSSITEVMVAYQY